MAAKSASGLFAKIFVSLLLVLLLCCVIGFLLYFTNNFTDNFKTFYLRYGSTDIKYDRSLELETGKTHVFACNYTLGFPGESDEPKYSVKILPARGIDFDFTVDGSVYSFGAEKDLTAGFRMQQLDASFLLTLPATLSMLDVLQGAYPGKTVADVPALGLSAKAYFVLAVSSYNGAEILSLGLKLKPAAEVMT